MRCNDHEHRPSDNCNSEISQLSCRKLEPISWRQYTTLLHGWNNDSHETWKTKAIVTGACCSKTFLFTTISTSPNQPSSFSESLSPPYSQSTCYTLPSCPNNPRNNPCNNPPWTFPPNNLSRAFHGPTTRLHTTSYISTTFVRSVEAIRITFKRLGGFLAVCHLGRHGMPMKKKFSLPCC